MREARVAKAA
jgi:hypothetical protein